MLWIVAANSVLCRIYRYDENTAKIILVKEFSDPLNKLKKSDYFTSDKQGSYQNDTSGRGAFSPHSDPKEVETNNFLRKIAEELNKSRVLKEYSKIVLILDPHAIGLIGKHLNKNVKKLVALEIQKDLVELSAHELLNSIRKDLNVLF